MPGPTLALGHHALAAEEPGVFMIAWGVGPRRHVQRRLRAAFALASAGFALASRWLRAGFGLASRWLRLLSRDPFKGPLKIMVLKVFESC